MDDAVELNLEFPCSDGGWASEMACVAPVGANLYRFEETPVASLIDGVVSSLAGASWKDVVEVDQIAQGALRVHRIVQKSSYKRFNWVLSKSLVESETFKRLLQRVVKEQGHWEIVFGGVVIAYLPFNSGFDVSAEVKKITT